VWWITSVIPDSGREAEGLRVQGCLGYIVRSCLKTKQEQKQKLSVGAQQWECKIEADVPGVSLRNYK
jgi:hypothetical protein